MRIGIGYDVHRLVSGRSLVLGGCTIPFERGLEGHSDADVLLHAIGDAVLGASGLGDIGRHFPDTDQRYRDISSCVLLERIAERARGLGLACANVDSVIVAQRPRLAPYIERMQAHIARCLSIDPAQVNVKATTTEGLGPEGSGEAISAQAVVLLQKISNVSKTN